MNLSNSNINLNFKPAERKHFACSNTICLRANGLLAWFSVKWDVFPAEVPDNSLNACGLILLSPGRSPSEAKSQALDGNFCAYPSEGFSPRSETRGRCAPLICRIWPNDWEFLKPDIMPVFCLRTFLIAAMPNLRILHVRLFPRCCLIRSCRRKSSLPPYLLQVLLEKSGVPSTARSQERTLEWTALYHSPVFSEGRMKILLPLWDVFPDSAAVDLAQENSEWYDNTIRNQYS